MLENYYPEIKPTEPVEPWPVHGGCCAKVKTEVLTNIQEKLSGLDKTRASTGDIVEALQTIKPLVVGVLMFFSMSVEAVVTPVYVPHYAVDGQVKVMTNMQEWVSSGGGGGGGGVTPSEVTNIVETYIGDAVNIHNTSTNAHSDIRNDIPPPYIPSATNLVFSNAVNAVYGAAWTNALTDTANPNYEVFSNAVLTVGLNIDTNSFAQINAILTDLGGVPIEGAATTVGGLLLALAAAVAWLKKNKLGKTDNIEQSQVTGLPDALADKANKSHTHTKSEITDFPTAMPPTAHASSHSTDSSDAIAPADIGAQEALPTTGAANDTYAVNISGNAATATSIAEGSISKLWNSKLYANKYFVDADGLIYSAYNTGGCYFQSPSGKKYYLSSTSSYDSEGERVYEYSFTHESIPTYVMKYNSSTKRITQQWGDFRNGTIDNFNPFLSESIASIEFTGGGLTDYFSFTAALWQVSNSFVKTGAALYSGTTSYTANQWVVYDNKLWVSKQPTRSNAPYDGSAYWADMSSLSALFSIANTANNLDNIRTSASDATSAAATIAGKANSSDIPSLSGKTFDLSTDEQFKNMCIATARAIGAVVTHTTDDTSTGDQVARAYGITPTDATTYGDIETKAGLNDSDTPGDL